MRKTLLALFTLVASLLLMFAFGMWTMWSWTSPNRSEVWDDGVFYYIKTPDGNVWFYDMESDPE